MVTRIAGGAAIAAHPGGKFKKRMAVAIVGTDGDGNDIILAQCVFEESSVLQGASELFREEIAAGAARVRGRVHAATRPKQPQRPAPPEEKVDWMGALNFALELFGDGGGEGGGT